ncbi:hypothetical protein [Bacillus suaedae]|uniref:Uncharacterized protein n=1 Tax=Halalkalibacter suaedae TaxID=2822140 RepID=A0A941AQ34_9BACI|nr:hypothetical protein [Bacillus suaedae]MBP3950743.1 hypothetical protein [Bacillus suaedae]
MYLSLFLLVIGLVVGYLNFNFIGAFLGVLTAVLIGIVIQNVKFSTDITQTPS